VAVPDKLLLATENRGKAREMSQILGSLLGRRSVLITLNDIPNQVAFPEEEGESFEEIAASKAAFATQATGLPSIADDSGLCVDSLSGAPGIKSRRWVPSADSDEARNIALLHVMAAYPEQRSARFVTCAAVCFPDGRIVTAYGECKGSITRSPRGDNGFGYDSVFEVDGLRKTMAELSESEKDAVSHRGRAIIALVNKLGWNST
jgi:XTP/dITP diphosphohydrolase